MRLIDADRLMDNLRGNVLIDVTPELEDTIAQQPTAFDKEKVINKLKHLENDTFNYSNRYDDKIAFGESSAFRAAIEIVEKGGIE